MENEKFDELARGIAAIASRRSVIKGTAAGALAGLLAGKIGDAPAGAQRGDGAAAEGGPSAARCTPNGQRCGRNGGKKSRPCKKCCSRFTTTAPNGRQRCACRPSGQTCRNSAQCCTGICANRTCTTADGALTLREEGSGTLTRVSPDGCQFTPAGCTNTIAGTIDSGTPVASGDFTGSLTGTNFQPGGGPNEFTSDVTGAITLTEDGTNSTIVFQVAGQQEGNDSTNASSFDGTYTIASGTGRFTGATGTGTVTANGTAGALENVTLAGTIDLP